MQGSPLVERLTSIYYTLYNCLLALCSPFLAVYMLYRYLSDKSRTGWGERWGHLPSELLAGDTTERPIWMHAVSAGEVVAAVPVLRELASLLPGRRIVLSVTTPAGHEMAHQQALPFVSGIFYFPFDFPWIARHVVRSIRPQVFVTVEGELWPNMLHELRAHGAAAMLVNGRVSDGTYRRVRRYAADVFTWVLGNVDQLLMQSAADAVRVKSLGGPGLEVPGRVQVDGNSKFDQHTKDVSPSEVSALRKSLCLPPDAQVLVAGSTRSPEEEAEVLDAYALLRKQHPNLCLIIAPRHVERAGEIVAALVRRGFAPARRTELSTRNIAVQEIVLDTLGELADIYAVSTVAFVGNSLPPVVKGGGQNLIQPLAHGKPVFLGPHIATIRSEAAMAVEAGVAFRVANGADLCAQIAPLLEDNSRLDEIAIRARNLVRSNRGASARYAKAIAGFASTETESGKALDTYRARFLVEALHGRPGLVPMLIRAVAAPLARIYCAGLDLFLLPYRIGLRRQAHLSCPVVSIGNITTGGTGKTPMTQWVCRYLQTQKMNVAVLSRGYLGGSEHGCLVVSDGTSVLCEADEAGDEPFLLAKSLPGVPVIVGKDRRKTGRVAVERFNPDILVLDDGMQYYQLHRDLEVTLLNAADPFDNGWTLPRGLLREPPSHLIRSNIVILTGAAMAGRDAVSSACRAVHRFAPNLPVIQANLVPTGLHVLESGEAYGIEWLAGKKCAALSAIGNPGLFEQSLEQLGATIVVRFRFQDHSLITKEQFSQCAVRAQNHNADAVVMTAKDAVKLQPVKSGIKILVLEAAIELEPEQALLDLLSAQARHKREFS